LTVNSEGAAAPPAEPRRLSIRLFRQQASEWCFAAVAQAVAMYFDPANEVHQCQIVGRGFKRACCGERMAPVRSPECNRQGYLHTVLDAMGLLAQPAEGGPNKWIEGPAPFALIQREIDAGRPVCVLIRWKNGGGGHFTIVVTSPVFAGKSRVESQRLVLSAIAHLMRGDRAPAHAVDSLRTLVP